MKRVYKIEINTRLSNRKQAVAQKKFLKDENYIVKCRNRLFEKTKMKITVPDLMSKNLLKFEKKFLVFT